MHQPLSLQNNTSRDITHQISRKLLTMEVLTSDTCWAVNNEIIKQVTSSWSLFIQISQISSEYSWKYNLFCFIFQQRSYLVTPPPLKEEIIWVLYVGTNMSSSPFHYVNLAFKLSCKQHCSVCNSHVFLPPRHEASQHGIWPVNCVSVRVSGTVTSLFRLQYYSHCMHGTRTIMYHSLTSDYRFNSSDFVLLLCIIFVMVFCMWIYWKKCYSATSYVKVEILSLPFLKAYGGIEVWLHFFLT